MTSPLTDQPLRSQADVRTSSAAVAVALTDSFLASGGCGWDPYDALSSRYLRAIARTRFSRRLCIQLVKRSPVNLRGALGVPRQVHTKGLALGLSAVAQFGVEETAIGELHEKLEAASSRSADSRGWGYDFDVQTRWGFYERGRPNAIATAFAANALLDAGASADELGDVVEFIRGLRQPEGWFAYFEGSSVAIHNANLLLAGVLARLGEAEMTRAAVEYSLSSQLPDGSWPYGEAPGLEWVDGFHTAYVLDALHRWAEETGSAGADDAIARGLDLYLRRLVDPDGAARHTLRSRYPVDTHALASGITMLVRLRDRDERALPTAERMLDWALRHMLRRDGRLAFQQHRLYRNSIPYVRWSDAHMLLALATYLETVDG